MHRRRSILTFFFFFNDTATTEIYTLSLHDALPISGARPASRKAPRRWAPSSTETPLLRSEEHTSELQSHSDLVCRLLLEKKKTTKSTTHAVTRHETCHSSNSTVIARRTATPSLC